MKTQMLKAVLLSCVLGFYSITADAENRRDAGSGQASKKAQYMLKMLHKEKQELQAKLAQLQAEHDALKKTHEKQSAKLEQSSDNNDMLVERLKGTTEKYKDLADKYREAVGILRKANMDNQYMVKAVQEREKWIASCTQQNEALFEANSDLLGRYGAIARDKASSLFGTGVVEVENEVQDYQFKLEDLQVTRYKPEVDVVSRTREADQGLPADGTEEGTNLN